MRWLLPKRKLGMKKSNSSPTTAPVHNQKFNEATGQVYTEKTASIQSSDDQNWTRQPRSIVEADYRDDDDYREYAEAWEKSRSVGKLAEFQKYLDGVRNSRAKGFIGARSLQDSAIECILGNISDITLEGIECLPMQIVRRVWREVNKRSILSFNTWMIFSTLLREDDTLTLDLFRYRQAIPIPKSPLHIYTKPLTSKSFDFMTSLSITTPFPLSDLVKLSDITNLGVLEIVGSTRPCGCESVTGHRFSGVGDRLIRDWHLAAVNDGAFPVLRILKLWNHEELTGNSLPFLNSFPSLAIYDVRGCNFDPGAKTQARALGWRPTFDTNIRGLLEAACVERAMLMQESLGIKAKPLRKVHAQQLSDSARVQRMSRADVPAFLARPQAVVPGESPHQSKMYHGLQRHFNSHEGTDLEYVKKRRWRVLDIELFAKSRGLETWDFTTYTTFNRVGELRNDSDLAKAGVHIGDQALVGDELVNSVPIASLRLGLTMDCLLPLTANTIHKPFYSSMYSEPNVSFKYDPEAAGTGQARSTYPSSRTLSFTRIKVPSSDTMASKSDDHTRLKDGLDIESGDGGSVKSGHSVPMKRQGPVVARNKKRRLGDILSSFL